MHARLLAVCGAAAAFFCTGALASETKRVIVAFKPEAAHRALSMARSHANTNVGLNAVVADLSPQAVRALENDPQVDYVEEDVKRYPLSLATPSAPPYAGGQLVPYGIKMVQADQLPDTYAANRKLCIIDSGYDLAHPDLSANAVTGENDPGSGAWNVDDDGHGTHVAGTIAAMDNTGGVVGVAPNRQLRLHIIKVFNAEGWAYSSDLVGAANRCASAGANVISMSLGGLFKSRTEQRAFDALAARGILSVAAAGNDGNTRVTYPAGYGSVVSVAAVDVDKRKAPFSQYNKDVELAAPGVGVLSSVPVGTGRTPSLSVGTAVYAPGVMQGSPTARASGALADFGLGDVVIPAMAGKVCLIQRGSINFAVKVANCHASGGVAAVVYNNALGAFSGTLGGAVTSIPSVTASDTDGAALRMQVGQTATVGVAATNHEHWQGTSMATPHVSAVAALVWSYFPGCNASQIRSTLQRSAEDLGEPGRDAEFGFGLVRARAAYERIRDHGCGH